MDKMSVSSSKNGRTDLTWNTIPAEVLEKVLTPLYSLFKPKDMAKLREVCKHWRDVIDEHFPFRLTVNDKKMDVTKLSHLRLAPSVVVSSLVTELDPEVSIFKDPTEITEFNIWGHITPRNFQRLMVDAVNLKQLSLNEDALCTKNLMKPLPNMEAKFQEAWERLESLTMTRKYPEPGNLFEILSTEMPNLQIFNLAFHIPNLNVFEYQPDKILDDLFSFLDRNQNLTVLQLCIRNVHCCFGQNPMFPVYTGDKQFESMELSATPTIWHSWLPLVEAQRSLKRLQVAMVCPDDHIDIPNPADTCLVTALEATLRLNQTTLTCIQFKNFNLAEDLNAGIFAEISNLRRLELQRNQKKGPFREWSLIVNLGMLPNSIEILNLRGFTCDPADLLQMTDRLEKIKHVDLVEIQNAGNGGPAVSLPVLESLARKGDIRWMVISPLNFNPLVVENPYKHVNGKYFLLINGYWIEVLYAGRNYYVKFHFGQ